MHRNTSTTVVSFKDKMISLQCTIKKNEDTTEKRFQMIGDTLNKMVMSNKYRFNQIELAGQIQTQACMMGIQELAAKLNLQISPTKELLKKAMQCTSEPMRHGTIDKEGQVIGMVIAIRTNSCSR